MEPEDLDIDIDAFLTTHSHDDHADPETISRFSRNRHAKFIGPWESVERYKACRVPASDCELIHPNQTITLDGLELLGTFALPTDATDLNHTGVLVQFTNGISFYDSGDTGYCELLKTLLPQGIDISSILHQWRFNNLDAMQAARIVKASCSAASGSAYFPRRKLSIPVKVARREKSAAYHAQQKLIDCFPYPTFAVEDQT